jgi:type II secretory pathway pseudopilin PulG
MMVQHRKAFSLITSIFVIVMMATVGILVMNMTSKTIKETTGQYRKEQAVLLAKSYTELAIMAVTANDRPNGCIQKVNGKDIIADSDSGKGYDVVTRIYYIGKDSTANLDGNCDSASILSKDVETDGSDLQIIVDVYVRYKELDNTNADWITYHRRTLQKI